MVELRTFPSEKCKNGKLDALWNPDKHTITIRNTHLGIDTTYLLDEATGTYEIIESVSYTSAA